MTPTRAMAEHLERRVLFALYRPDPSFGDGGSVNAPANFAIEQLPDGKILTLGQKVIPPQFFDDLPTYITVASRVNADGTIDTSFGQNGSVEFGEADWAVLAGSTVF